MDQSQELGFFLDNSKKGGLKIWYIEGGGCHGIKKRKQKC